VIPVSASAEPEGGVFVRRGAIVSRVGGAEREVAAIRDLGIHGAHNVQNAMVATAAAMAVGVDAGVAGRALESFEPLEHRMEPVAEVGGVLYVNDSKATNVDSVRYALESYEAPVVLIAGGREKGADFGALRPAVERHVKHAVLLGEAAAALEAALSGATTTERAGTLRDAVEAAAASSLRGDVVLLSPACASFDMFVDFEDRGRRFKALVAELAEARARQSERK
jgi:UDP-N-acetylmuramoylalanine--D-glutamate ligase